MDGPAPVEQEGEKQNEYLVLSERPENWGIEWALSEYVNKTDGLIGKLDGSIPLSKVAAYHEGKKEVVDLAPPSAVIYLDKSARPVRWLVNELWPTLAEPYQDTGELPKQPDSYFLNIDKEDWLRRMGVPPEHLQDAPDEMIDFSKIDLELIARIRALYSTTPIDEAHINDAWEHPTKFDNQHIMIVDEVKSSGKTLEIAKRLLSAAIPQATFSGQYWAEPGRTYLNGGAPDKDGRMQFKINWVPAWYSQSTESGRGIGNRDPRWPKIAESKGIPVSEVQKVGRHVLGTRLRDPQTNEPIADLRSQNLRADIKKLGKALKAKKILYRPSSDRLISDDKNSTPKFIERLEKINGMSFNEWKVKKSLIEPKKPVVFSKKRR